MGAQQGTVPGPPLALFDRRSERLRGGLVEKHAGLVLPDRIERAAASPGYDRPTGGVGLERRHPEVFLTGEEQRPAFGERLHHLVIRGAAAEGDGGSRQPFESCPVRTVADNDEPALQQVAGRNRQINPLVGRQPRDDQIVAAGVIRAAETCCFNGRRDHDGLAAVDHPNPVRRRPNPR